jgi:hypothetical protein
MAIEANAGEKRALLIQCLSPVMSVLCDSTNGDADCAPIPTDRGEWKVNGAALKSVIRDRSLVRVAWEHAFHDRLQFEPCRKVSEDGIVADGLLALLGQRPLLSLVAIGDDLMELQVGGFDKSAVGHPGNLLDLSRQVIESDTLPRNKRRH